MKLTCPICGKPVHAGRPNPSNPGEPWNIACEECGLCLYGDEYEPRRVAEAKWAKMRPAETIISVGPTE